MNAHFLALAGSVIIGSGIYFAVNSAKHDNRITETKLRQHQTPAPKSITPVVDTPFKLPSSSSRFPAMLIKKNEKDEKSVQMRISKVKVDVKVTGNIATTLFDITYCNELDRVLDGQFCFPLGEGQSISYFALENEGKLNEASIVEKAKGRQTYEAVIRQKIDPALLEWTAGNNFKARVYPIPAKGCKRVVVGFEQELLYKGRSAVYHQPLQFPNKLDEFSVHAEVMNLPAEPVKLDEQGIPVKFERKNEIWEYSKNFTSYNADDALAFEVPQNSNDKNYFVEKSAEGTMFYLNIVPKKYRAEKQLPSSLCLLWDVSGSAAARSIEKERVLVNAYLKKCGNVNVQLVTFSNEIHSNEKINVSGGNTEELDKKIKALVYDGGTQLGNLDLSAYSCDEFILVSDGISNFGKEEIKITRTPVNVICSSPSSDYSYLKGICQSSGGVFLNIQNGDQAAHLDQLSTLSYSFISCDYDASSAKEIYPSSPVPVNGNFTMAGMLNSYKAELKLNFGVGNKVMHTETITIHNEPRDYKNMIAKAWSGKKLNELDIFYAKNKDEITSLGKKYNLVTRNTSLLVLDRIEDYIEHQVEPKDPELKKEYLSSVKKQETDFEEKKKTHLEQVVNQFSEWKLWYDKDFPRVKTKKKEQAKKVGALTDSVAVDREVVVHEVQMMAEYSISNNNVNLEDVQVVNTPGRVNYVTPVVDPSATKADIQLSAWNPETPYMKKLRAASGNYYASYLNLKKEYASQPSFYIDVSDFFVKMNDRKNALRILSNIAELEMENHALLRVLAHRLQELEETKLAISAYEKVLKIREEEPQSYRDLGLAYADDRQYQKAADYLCKVINRSWDSRFPEVECIAATELNHLIATCGQQLQLDSLDERLIKPMPCDVRIVINWDTDNCDMDLWVTDAWEEKCMYSHPLTESGGKMSRDFTGGYGPEAFMIKRALDGKYKVQVNYYGTRNEGLTGPTTVQAELYTNWGRSGQKKKTITLRLENKQEVIDIGELAFGNQSESK